MLEELRELMHLYIDKYGVDNELTVLVSQQLDIELNKEGVVKYVE